MERVRSTPFFSVETIEFAGWATDFLCRSSLTQTDSDRSTDIEAVIGIHFPVTAFFVRSRDSLVLLSA